MWWRSKGARGSSGGGFASSPVPFALTVRSAEYLYMLKYIYLYNIYTIYFIL